jgi:hypothetical protein
MNYYQKIKWDEEISIHISTFLSVWTCSEITNTEFMAYLKSMHYLYDLVQTGIYANEDMVARIKAQACSIGLKEKDYDLMYFAQVQI